MEAGHVGRHGLGGGEHHGSCCSRRRSVSGVHGHRCAVVLEGPLQPSLAVLATETDAPCALLFAVPGSSILKPDLQQVGE